MCKHCEKTEGEKSGPSFVFLPVPLGEVDVAFRLHRPLTAQSEPGAISEARYMGPGKVARIIGEVK